MKIAKGISNASFSPMDVFWWTIAFLPLWWVLGLRFMIFHIVVIYALVKTLKRLGKTTLKDFPIEWIFLMIFILIYFVSLLINFSEIPVSRLLASINNLSFWVMGFLIIFIIYHSINRQRLIRFFSIFPVIGLVSSLFVIFSLALGFASGRTYGLKSLLMTLMPDRWIEFVFSKALLLRSSLKLVIVGQDKLFQKPFFRSPGFNIYTTAFALSMIVFLVMTIIFFKEKSKRKTLVLFVTFEIVALLLSLSRIAVLGAVFSAVMVLVLSHSLKFFWRRIFPVGLAVVLIFLALISPQKAISTIADFRKGSTVWRGRLYVRTIEEGLQKPILGHGFKPRPEDFPVPIGSHSTYIGTFYKTGLFGSIVFLFFWGAVVRRWWLHKKITDSDKFLHDIWTYTGIALISGLIWMLTEDLDAPPIAAFLYFIIVGLALSIDKLKSNPDQAPALNSDRTADQSLDQTADQALPFTRDPNSSEPHI